MSYQPLNGQRHRSILNIPHALLLVVTLGIHSLNAEEPPPPEAEGPEEQSEELIQESGNLTLPGPLQPAFEQYEQGDYDGTVESVKKALSELRDSEKDRAFLLLGMSSIRQNRFARAAQYLKRSLSLRARNSDAWHLMGIAAYHEDRLEESEQHLREAVWRGEYTLLSPADSFMALSIVYDALDMPEKKAEVLQRAVADRPESIEVRIAGAREALKQGESKRAIELLPFPTVKKSDNPDAVIAFAEAFLVEGDGQYQEGRFKELIEMLKKIGADSEPGSIQHWNANRLLIRSHLRLNDVQSAGEVFDTVQSNYPEDPQYARLKKQIAIQREDEEDSGADEGSPSDSSEPK